MLDDDDFQVPETRYAAQCPHCTERLQFEQDGDQLQLDDPASCHFHGVIGTRRDILRAIKNGDIQTVRYDVPNTPPQKGLNKWGYLPQPGDVTLLARIMFAEANGEPWDYPDIGWATINRVGAPGRPDTLSKVILQPSQFHGVNNLQWRLAANPSSLTGPNRRAYAEALQVAQAILDGKMPDPTRGATHFFSGPSGGKLDKNNNPPGYTITARVPPFTFMTEP